jgi:putative redox protein
MSAHANGFSLQKISSKTTKIMASNPRRISEIIIEFDLTHTQYTEKQKQILENAARNCPVAKTIHPDILADIRFL